MLEGLGRFGIFIGESLRWLVRRPFRWRLIVDEIEFIGNGSLFIVAISGLSTGAVSAYQSWLGLKQVRAEALVGASVALGLLRELAPVMCSIVVAGRAGAAIAAQLGIMRVTEQIDALEVMGVDSKQYLVLPKIIAGLIAFPFLVAIFGLIGNLGGYYVGVEFCGIDSGIYIAKLRNNVTPGDFFHGMLKALFFGFFVASIASYQGYNAKRGAAGVGTSTNVTVVYSIIFILVADYFLTLLFPVRG